MQELIAALQADVVGLQEAEPALVDALIAGNDWRLFWSPKLQGKPDGCLMLVTRKVKVLGFRL